MVVAHWEQEKCMSSSAAAFAQQNQARFLEELKDLLRIPSVSTLPEHAGDVRRAAEFLVRELQRIGLEHVRLIETAGHPLVYADWLHAPGKPTCLCYGHYDVQPPDPLEEWLSPPFEPAERNGNLYARGAVDDKGQMYMHIKALESLMRAHGGKLPLNVRLLIEGEEEVGGEGIAAYLRQHPETLVADFALVSDNEMFAPGLPTLCVGLRGMIYTELEVRGAKTDLHSGLYGGAAPNPLQALCWMLAQMKTPDGRIQIPGFYDELQAPSAAEQETWKRLPFDEQKFLHEEIGSVALTGEAQYTVLERLWVRPTLEIHGMPGGFTGAGAKTVIPARALAKVSMRLAPEMQPQRTFERYKHFAESICPAGVTVEVRLIHSGDAIVIGTDNPYVRAAMESLHAVFGRETVLIRSGGSIPIVGDFERCLKIPTVMMGFGLPDDNLHAPNEKFCIANYHSGIATVIDFFERLGR
jgi:acetylornithine deacetylase/succinyl-diaminopimelate desuccinylase-like protein